MKKLIFIIAFFVSQVGFEQYNTFQVFTNYDEIFENIGNEPQFVEPFHGFLSEHGFYYNYIHIHHEVYFDDDPGNYILQMFVVPEQANALENLLIDSDIIFKYIRYDGETPYYLDRLYIEFFEIPEFLGIQDGVVVTDDESLNIVFEAYQIDNYEQFESSPNFLIRCNGCDIFELAQEIVGVDIVENAFLTEYSTVLSLDEIEKLNGIILSPNPNDGDFEIVLNSGEFIGTQLTIFDTLGKKVHEENLLETKNPIQLDGINPGIYFLRLDYKGKSSVKKFIVRK